jgi:hypothetical protein
LNMGYTAFLALKWSRKIGQFLPTPGRKR